MYPAIYLYIYINIRIRSQRCDMFHMHLLHVTSVTWGSHLWVSVANAMPKDVWKEKFWQMCCPGQHSRWLCQWRRISRDSRDGPATGFGPAWHRSKKAQQSSCSSAMIYQTRFDHAMMYIYMQPLYVSVPSKAEFIRKVTVIKERMSTKEQEVHGRWLTEERMKKLNEWSASAIKSMVAFCKKFPETLCRTQGGELQI